MQTKFGDPDGNCLEACIASLTGIPLDAIPHFLTDDWVYQYRKWLFDIGWHFAFFFVGEIKTPVGLVIANGESPRGLPHSVIYDRGKLAHDPHPDGGGILSVDSWIVIDVTEAAIIRDTTIDSLRTQLAILQDGRCTGCMEPVNPLHPRCACVRAELAEAIDTGDMWCQQAKQSEERETALLEALAKWSCHYCHGRKTNPCRCDGQACRPGCDTSAPCRVCKGTGLNEIAARALSGEQANG